MAVSTRTSAEQDDFFDEDPLVVSFKIGAKSYILHCERKFDDFWIEDNGNIIPIKSVPLQMLGLMLNSLDVYSVTFFCIRAREFFSNIETLSEVIEVYNLIRNPLIKNIFSAAIFAGSSETSLQTELDEIFDKTHPADLWPGFTTLMKEACLGNVERVNELLKDPECDINAVDPFVGNSALMMAVYLGHAEIVRVLLKRPNCKSETMNGLGHTAFDVALDRSHAAIARILIAHGCPFSPPLPMCEPGFFLAQSFVTPEIKGSPGAYRASLLRDWGYFTMLNPRAEWIGEYWGENSKDDSPNSPRCPFSRSIMALYKKLQVQQCLNLNDPVIFRYIQNYLLSRAEGSALSAEELKALKQFDAKGVLGEGKILPREILELTSVQITFLDITLKTSTVLPAEESKEAKSEFRIPLRDILSTVKKITKECIDKTLQAIWEVITDNNFSAAKSKMFKVSPNACATKIVNIITGGKTTNEKLLEITNELVLHANNSDSGFLILKNILAALPHSPEAMVRLCQRFKEAPEFKMPALK